MILELSVEAQNEIKKYFTLNFSNKEVKAPYFINIKGQKGGLRVMVGKGSSEEIELEVKVWAQVKGFDIEKADQDQIRQFMLDLGIGIDCSGFVVHVINQELKARGLKSIWHYLNFRNNSIFFKIKRILRPIENIGAELITDPNNCISINNFDDIMPSDLIRAKGKQKNAHHVAVITKVEKNEVGNTLWFEYAHSHRYYENENGVRIGRVTIVNRDLGLKDQQWDDNLNGRNYMYEDLMAEYEDNGIRRLKILVDTN